MKKSLLKKMIAVLLCLMILAGSEQSGFINIMRDVLAAEKEDVLISETGTPTDESGQPPAGTGITGDESAEIEIQINEEEPTETEMQTEEERTAEPDAQTEEEEPKTWTDEKESSEPDTQTEEEKPEEPQTQTDEEEPEDTVTKMDEKETAEDTVIYPEYEKEVLVDGGRVKVHIRAAEGALPEEAEPFAKPIVEPDAEILEADGEAGEEEVQAAKELQRQFEAVKEELEAYVMEDQEKVIADFLAYEIRFLIDDEEGETTEVEPKGEVSITLEFEEAVIPETIEREGTLQAGSVDVVHIKETEEGIEVREIPEAEIDMTEDGKVEQAEFVSDGSSIYALTWITQTDPEGRCTYEDDHVVIRINAEEGAVLADAGVKVIPVVPSAETAEQYLQVAGLLEEKAEEAGYEIAGFLAYDISLVDKEGMELEPEGRVKVTMDYKKAAIPDSLKTALYAAENGAQDTAHNTQMDVAVLHLEEDSQGEVIQITDLSESGQVSVLETTEDQEISRAEFVTESFSNFVIEWRTEAKGAIPKSDTTASMNTASIMEQTKLPEGKNAWQIVAGEYKGNSATDKTLSDGKVRLQKNVIPTDVENEFLVYLSVDMKSVFESYFSHAKYQATTSNNNHDQELGALVTSMTGNKSVEVSVEPIGGNSAYFTVKDHNENTLVENLCLYWDQANNVTFYLKINESEFVIVGVQVNKNNKNNVIRLSSEAEEAIRKDIMNKVSLGTVIDQMGDYIIYKGIVAGDYETEPVCDADGTLTWYPLVKGEAATATEETSADGKTITTTWSLNAAELLYKVRLDVTKVGFQSCADNMNSGVRDSESYPVNTYATLQYDGGTVDFPVPYVRGLLYDMSLVKKAKDEDDKDLGVLPGAEFEIKDEESGITRSAESDKNGIVRFDSLPWGSYTVTETKAPDGYESEGERIGPVTLCYTTDATELIPDTEHTSNMIHRDYAKSGSDKNVVYNKEAYTSVEVVKEWTDQDNALNTRPERISFILEYREKGSSSETDWEAYSDDTYSLEKPENGSPWKLVIEKLPAGYEYRVTELAVPGYTSRVKPADTSGGVTTITVRNVLQSQIKKVSASDGNLPLADAGFELKTKTGEVKLTGTSGQGGIVIWGDGSSLEDLPDDTYELAETNSPVGYACSKETWEITVKDGLVTSVIVISGDESRKMEGELEDGIQTFRFEDTPVYQLPSAGSIGIYWYAAGGTLLMLAAVLSFYKNQRQRRC